MPIIGSLRYGLTNQIFDFLDSTCNTGIIKLLWKSSVYTYLLIRTDKVKQKCFTCRFSILLFL